MQTRSWDFSEVVACPNSGTGRQPVTPETPDDLAKLTGSSLPQAGRIASTALGNQCLLRVHNSCLSSSLPTYIPGIRKEGC